ncbi:MAG: outer membrane beta-barrel protein [Burkholderiales bacterium]
MNYPFRRFILGALFAVISLGSAPAFSQDQAFYAGAAFGQSKFKDGCSGVANCDDSDTSLSIFGGYQFNKHFAAEIGYTDLGKATAPGASVEATGFEFTAVGTLPLNPQFSLYGKLGFFMWDADARGPGGSFSDDGTDLTYAIGVRWNFAKNLAAQLQWQRYEVDDLDADVIGIGILFRF